MSDRLLYTVTLTVRSPFLFRGLEGAVLGIDTPHLRDEQGRPIIPADQVRGVLREALGDLAAAGAGIAEEDIPKLFGGGSDDQHGEPGRSNDPHRAAIEFTDLTAHEPLPAAGETTRIEIDDDTGAVKRGMLQVIELVAPFGKAVAFTGTLVLFRPRADAERFARLFQQALALVSSIGAFKSPGFGEVVADASRIDFQGATPLAVPARAEGTVTEFRQLRVRFDRPILVDGDKIAPNAVQGSTIVPGAVIKGALAQRLQRAGQNPEQGVLGAALSRMSISHAFPESRDGRWPHLLPLPLSLVAAEDGDGTIHYGDALGTPPGKGAMIGGRPALFTTDWKPRWFGGAYTALNWPQVEEPPGLPRTHTAIDSGAGVAEDLKLFTTIARSVRTPAGEERRWLLDIDLGRVQGTEAQSAAEALVRALLADGLDSIGKTAAHARFEEVEDAAPAAPKPVRGIPNRYAVMLATPALMLDPVALTDEDGNWRKEPLDAYQGYWDRVLPGARLVDVYAEQRFKGGYLARRRRLYGPNVYFPFLLTLPGSVFLIETEDVGTLVDLCRYGLPLPALTKTVAEPGWRNCPYVPENGYGRIVADHLSADAGGTLTKVDHV